MSKIIEVKNLSKHFGKRHVLKNVSFSIEQGSFYALLGENGAGKSTILKILMGGEAVDRGEVLIFGKDMQKSHVHIKDKVGYVTENIHFDLPINMHELGDLYQSLYSHFNPSVYFDLAKQRNFNLNKKFNEYSRGQKMQICLMLSLALKPQVLFIDEITSVLDLYSRKFFMNCLHQFVKNGGTVVMTTNIINEVQNFATHLLMLKDGRIRMNSEIHDIPKHFIKLRKKDTTQHEIFSDTECFWAGENTDGSQCYIIPHYIMNKYEHYDHLIDRRNVQLDDIFIYLFNISTENGKESKDDQAA